MTVDFGNAKWIWTDDNKTADSKVVFRKKFVVSEVPKDATAYISCDTKFWLYINGREAVYEGGVFRESLPGCGYAECIDIAPYLVNGENTLSALVWFYGNQGRNNTNSGEAGFIFSCPELGLKSDGTFLALRHPAYIKGGEPRPSYLYGGDNICFDARRDFGDFSAPGFDDSSFTAACVYENRVWGEQVLSELPLIRVSEKRELAFTKTSAGVISALGTAMTLSVGFEAQCAGSEIIDIRTDRYSVNGGPGDEHNRYNSHRIEYICKPGKNSFECPMYLYGEQLIISFPDTVSLTRLTYRESGYDSDIVGSFITDNPLFNRLIEKSIRTLYVCMRNNFMDCPDRERGQWIGDVSVQTPQVFYIFDERALKLLRKSINDFINLRRGKVLVGNVPGKDFSELPSQSLVAISEFGLIGEYYSYTADKSVFEQAFEPVMDYLSLWDIGENGLVVGRNGNWRWFDHLYNVDEDVIENALYYSALSMAAKMAETLGCHKYDSFIASRRKSISEGFEKYFWHEDKGYYSSSPSHVDERACAVAVLAHLCPRDRYEKMRKILLTVFNSTPYFERFVLTALCEMGYVHDAFNRMSARYYNLTVNENSTLWEDFYILGTRNHAWTGCPIEIAFKYILGLHTQDGCESFSASPVAGIFNSIDCTVNTKNGIRHFRVDENNTVHEQ